MIGHLESVKQFVGLGFSVNGHYEVFEWGLWLELLADVVYKF